MSQRAAPPWTKVLSRLAHLFDPRAIELDKIGALAGLLILWLSFSLLSPSFRRPGNLLLIVTQAAPIGIVAVGQTLVLLTGGIDLSVSSIVALTGLVAASLMKYGFAGIPPLSGGWSYLAIAVGLLTGAAIGTAQGWLIANRRMPPFIVTLGTMVGLRGLTLSFSGGSSINSLPTEFKWISDGLVGPIPAQVLIMLAGFGVAWYVLRNTKFGRYCYAIGGNETAARLSGVKVDRTKISVYALSGLLAALAGMILMSHIDASNYTNGDGFELDSVAASVIGGTSLSGGIGGLWGTLIGVMIIRIVPDGMVMLNAPSSWRDVVTGAVILLAVLVDVERTRARKAVPRIVASPTPQTGPYLGEALAQVSQVVEKQLGCSNSRMYLVDRETGDLVPQELAGSGNSVNGKGRAAPGRDDFVRQAQESFKPVRVTDITRSGTRRVVPMQSDMHSALAVPLTVQNRVVGVLEVQSSFTDAFGDDAAALLIDCVDPMAELIEDSWLVESGWLARQTRDALRHLWDDHHLSRSPLAEWLLLANHPGALEPIRGARGEALRNQLLAAIEGLRPRPGETHEPSRTGRGRRILQLTYLEERAVDEITRDLHISRRQYFYDLKQAVEALTDMLVQLHQAGSRSAALEFKGNITKRILPHLCRERT